MTIACTRFSFPLALFLGRFLRIDDIARRRLGRVGRVLPRCGQLLFEPRVLLLQLVDPLKRRGQLDLQVGNLDMLASNLPCPLLTLRTLVGFPDFHGAGAYVLARNKVIRNHAPDLPALDRIPGELACRFFGNSWGWEKRLDKPDCLSQSMKKLIPGNYLREGPERP